MIRPLRTTRTKPDFAELGADGEGIPAGRRTDHRLRGDGQGHRRAAQVRLPSSRLRPRGLTVDRRSVTSAFGSPTAADVPYRCRHWSMFRRVRFVGGNRSSRREADMSENETARDARRRADRADRRGHQQRRQGRPVGGRTPTATARPTCSSSTTTATARSTSRSSTSTRTATRTRSSRATRGLPPASRGTERRRTTRRIDPSPDGRSSGRPCVRRRRTA